MHDLIAWFESVGAVQAALAATLFTWFMTALGASLVFVFREMKRKWFDSMLGFTGGVMVAASFWSLLAPAIEMSEGSGFAKVYPAAIGFGLGALFIYALDKLTPHLHINFRKDEAEGPATDWHRSTLLVLAITLHNIPEGLAVGVLFGGAALGLDGATVGAAVALAIGIGIQNFPEGLAVSMPLRRQGVSAGRSMWFGQLSAVVEPVAGVIGAIGGDADAGDFALCPGFCSGSNDLRCCGRGYSGNTARQIHGFCHLGIHRWIFGHDVPGCRPGLSEVSISESPSPIGIPEPT